MPLRGTAALPAAGLCRFATARRGSACWQKIDLKRRGIGARLLAEAARVVAQRRPGCICWCSSRTWPPRGSTRRKAAFPTWGRAGRGSRRTICYAAAQMSVCGSRFCGSNGKTSLVPGA